MPDPNIHQCLKPVLEQLQEASRDAVVDGSQALNSNFKEYFHVKRPIQEELETIIQSSSSSQSKQLILVCGNVGDGKSHLLSLLHQQYPEKMKGFTVHNDATESSNPKETYLDTLYKLLENFKDENLTNDTSQKIILAINLGTLTNFLEDQKQKGSFKKLNAYVKREKILENTEENDSEKKELILDCFKHVNFADYHLYELTKNGAKSQVITSLFEKLTQKKAENPVWQTYKTDCTNCDLAEKCPIKFNYEFIQSEDVKRKLEDLLIKCTVQHKHLISVRALLNFMYNLVVPLELAPLSADKLHQKIKYYQVKTFIINTLPNYLFEHPDLSSIFKYMHLLDPLSLRKEVLDQIIVQLITTDDITNTFQEHASLPTQASYFYRFLQQDFKKNERSKQNYGLLISLFMRWHFFKGKIKGKTREEEVYQKYLKTLYYFNKEGSEIENELHENLYDEIEQAVYQWNGDAFKNNMVNVFLGHQQNTYKISQSLELDVELPSNILPKEEEKLQKFKDTFFLKYSVKGEPISVPIDFELYQLLQKVVNGYRPNKLDKSNHINFVYIVDKVIRMSSVNATLVFHENNGKVNKGYQLSRNKFGKYKFEII